MIVLHGIIGIIQVQCKMAFRLLWWWILKNHC